MKKLLVTVIGVAAALGAFADSYTNAQRFEGMTQGETSVSALNTQAISGTYWYEFADATKTNEYAIEAWASSWAVPHPDAFAEESDPENALSVKTQFGKPLEFSVADGKTAMAIGDGLYFDSLVKFTVCEDDPAQNYDGAKIVLWLQEKYDANEEIAGTNLMVKAGFLSVGENGVEVSNAVYTCGNVIPGDFADKWHRVTIKAIADITESGEGVPGFAIYIDGNGDDYSMRANTMEAKWDSTFTYALTYPASQLGNALFPSMVQGSVAAVTTLTSAGFDGTGSLNDLVFTDVAPAFAADPEKPIDNTMSVSIDGGEATEVATFAEAVQVANTATAGQTVTIQPLMDVTLADPVEFTSSVAAITLDFAGFVLTNELGVAAITNNAANLTITNSTQAVGGIYCVNKTDAAVYAANGVATIEGGFFHGNVAATSTSNLAITGGYFTQDTVQLGNYLPTGKQLQPSSVMQGYYEFADKPTHTITFDADGGTPEPDSVVIYDGDPVEKPEDPTKIGYKFLGWYWNYGGSEEKFVFNGDEGEPILVDGDCTIYAKWEAEAPTTYTITVAAPGENVNVAVTTNNVEAGTAGGAYVVNAGDSARVEYTPAPGYQLTGAATYEWSNIAADASTIAPTATAIEYTITLDANGGTVSPATVTYTVATTAFDLPIPTKTESIFAGWTNETYTTAFTNFNYMSALANITLYAKWEASTPTPPEIKPGESITEVEVTANNEEAAIAAVKIVPPTDSGTTVEAYTALFNITATAKTGESGKYTVAITGIKDTVTTAVSANAVELLTGTAASGTVTIPAGLYYKIVPSTALPISGEAVKGLSTGATKTVTKPGTTQGFYEIKLSATPIE